MTSTYSRLNVDLLASYYTIIDQFSFFHHSVSIHNELENKYYHLTIIHLYYKNLVCIEVM